MISVLLQSEWPWQPNDTNTFFIYLCVSLYQESVFFKKKTLPTCFVLSARTTKFLFFMFSFMVYAALQRFLRIWTPLMKGQAQNIWRLNSQIWQDSTFVHCPLFVLNIPFYLLSLIGILFSLFICLDIFWRLVTTHATGTQLNSSRQMTSLDAIFCRGNKSSSHSLARCCEKSELDLWASLTINKYFEKMTHFRNAASSHSGLIPLKTAGKKRGELLKTIAI